MILFQINNDWRVSYLVACISCFHSVGSDVLTALSTKMAVFWVVAPCSLVEVYQCFRGPDDGGSKDL
jgi:hypothetical protein